MAGQVEHGGTLDALKAAYPAAPEPWLDLSTGINPQPWQPSKGLAASFDAPMHEALGRLPEPSAIAALEATACAAYGGHDVQGCVAAPGTQILISMLPRLGLTEIAKPDIAILGPTYTEHAIAWESFGSKVTIVADLAEAEASGAPVILAVNPNNPDGRRLAPSELLGVAKRLQAKGGLLIVDEAFADLEGDELSVIPFLPQPALVALRSFGKTYGLAGLRLGFALAQEPIARKIRDGIGPWAVSAPTIALGSAALQDAAWREETTARLRAEIPHLDAAIEGCGLRVTGGCLLFRLAEGTPAQIDAVYRRLANAGIAVRKWAARPHLLRFGLPADETAWLRLEATLRRATDAA